MLPLGLGSLFPPLPLTSCPSVPALPWRAWCEEWQCFPPAAAAGCLPDPRQLSLPLPTTKRALEYQLMLSHGWALEGGFFWRKCQFLTVCPRNSDISPLSYESWAWELENPYVSSFVTPLCISQWVEVHHQGWILEEFVRFHKKFFTGWCFTTP